MSFLATISRPGHLSSLKTNVQQPKVTCNHAFKESRKKTSKRQKKIKIIVFFLKQQRKMGNTMHSFGRRLFSDHPTRSFVLTQGLKKLKRNIEKNNNK